jgi:hypothetical protein
MSEKQQTTKDANHTKKRRKTQAKREEARMGCSTVRYPSPTTEFVFFRVVGVFRGLLSLLP